MTLIPTGRPRLGRAALLALGTLAAGAAPAAADTPVFEMPAQFTSGGGSGGSLVPDGPPAHAAVRGYPGLGAVGGHWASHAYCTPHGPGTAIVGFQYLAGRWHEQLGDGALVLANTDHGTVMSTEDRALPHRRADALGPWAGAAPATPATRCVGLQVVMRRSVAATTVTWTTQLTRVAVMDQVGPVVGAPAVQATWVTGDSVPVRFSQSDNAFNRGEVRGEAVGGGAVSLGDPPDGEVEAAVPVGNLPDGQHVVRVSRSAPGWDPRTATAVFSLDRTPPGTPELRVDTEAWTNADAVWATAEPSADLASGWSHNEFSVDGGPWQRRANRWAIESAGVRTVRARAVDRAGHVSGPSPERSVRIDRIAPVIGGLQVDAAAPGGPRVLLGLTDEGGSGLGSCPAVVAISGPGTPWTPVIELGGAALARTGEVRLPMRGMPSGDHQVRVSACDTAGNTSGRIARFTWHPSAAVPQAPAGVPAPRPVIVPPAGIAAGALRVIGMPRGGAVFGRRARIDGHLIRNGAPVQGAAIQVVDPSGAVIGAGRTAADGRIIATAVPTRGGVWRIRVVGREWAAAVVPMEVRPQLRVRAATRAGVLSVGVRVAPGMAGRIVRLQRRTGDGWATVLTARTGPAGVVRLATPSGVGRHRVLVPRQPGWDYAPAAAMVRAVPR